MLFSSAKRRCRIFELIVVIISHYYMVNDVYKAVVNFNRTVTHRLISLVYLHWSVGVYIIITTIINFCLPILHSSVF